MWTNLIILSQTHSQMNFRKSCNKTSHLISNLLKHYVAKVECSTYAQLFIHISQNNEHQILVSCYDDKLGGISC